MEGDRPITGTEFWYLHKRGGGVYKVNGYIESIKLARGGRTKYPNVETVTEIRWYKPNFEWSNEALQRNRQDKKPVRVFAHCYDTNQSYDRGEFMIVDEDETSVLLPRVRRGTEFGPNTTTTSTIGSTNTN